MVPHLAPTSDTIWNISKAKQPDSANTRQNRVPDTQFDSLQILLMSCITKSGGSRAETNNWRKQYKQTKKSAAFFSSHAM